MKKRYSAALLGIGGFTALRRAWQTRFNSIQSVIIINDINEKLTLEVYYDASKETDIVELISSNWQTGEQRTLFKGTLGEGKLFKKRQPKD